MENKFDIITIYLTISQYSVILYMKFINKLFCLFFYIIFNNINAQSLQEIERLKNEYEEALNRQSLQKSSEIKEAEATAKSTALPDKLVYSRKDIESLLVNTQNLLEELKFLKDSSSKIQNIGYDIFTQRDTIPFWQNLPIPKNYILGPGDEVIISIWGEINSYISRKINREGEIFIENIGILNLSDKNLEQAKTYVNSKFARVYSTLTGENPKSFVDLSLGELKSVNIHFVGFVNIPGVHTIHPFSNIVAGLTQAGGVDFRGSLRSIELIRNDKTIAVFDLYDYIFKGKSITSVRLMDQDIIFVPPRLSRVALNGQVLTAGYFEISKDETLQNLINFSGGQLASATSQLFLYSLAKNTSKIINNKSFTNFYLSDGDSIFVPKNPTLISLLKSKVR